MTNNERINAMSVEEKAKMLKNTSPTIGEDIWEVEEMTELKPCPFCGGEADTHSVLLGKKANYIKGNMQL